MYDLLNLYLLPQKKKENTSPQLEGTRVVRPILAKKIPDFFKLVATLCTSFCTQMWTLGNFRVGP